MPDLDLVNAKGPLRPFTLLHRARPFLLNLGEPGDFDIGPWADRVRLIDAEYAGTWELPAIGVVTGPTAVLVRPDGYAAWVGDHTQEGLRPSANHLVRIIQQEENTLKIALKSWMACRRSERNTGKG